VAVPNRELTLSIKYQRYESLGQGLSDAATNELPWHTRRCYKDHEE